MTPLRALTPPITIDTWAHRGACRTIPKNHKEWFFSESHKKMDKAKAICATCPVRIECLEHAVTVREKGIWGGETGQGRERIRREQGRSNR